MVAPSDVPENYSENRILYKKELINGVEAFVFSNNPDDELFNVKFSLVGDNQGNYTIINGNAINNIYEYVPPVNGVPQGNYEPVVQLIAPTKLQIAVLNATYKPTEKTDVYFEVAGSKNDLNLFSGLDDANNDGFATKLKVNQKLIQTDSLWNLNAYVDADIIQENFKTIQRLYYAEFNRDWNLEDPLGNQNLLSSGVELFHPKKGIANYKFEYLGFSENFTGNRHSLLANLNFKGLNVFTNTSITKSDNTISDSRFLGHLIVLCMVLTNNGWCQISFRREQATRKTIR